MDGMQSAIQELMENEQDKSEKSYQTAREAGTTGNILVLNEGLNPAPSFNFMLRVEGIYDLPCRAIHVFQNENEYELIQEGGLNDYVHMRRKPISKPFTFQVERYVNLDWLDPMANGTELTLPVILFVSRYHKLWPIIRMYVFTGCTVMGKQYGELNSEKSGLLVETTTLAYRQLFCINNPVNSLVSDPWKPGWDKEDKSSTKVKYARTPASMGLDTGESQKHLWKESETDSGRAIKPKDKGVTELTKKQLEEKAAKRQWNIKAEASDPRELAGLDKQARQKKEAEQAAARKEFGKTSTKSAVHTSDKGYQELSKEKMQAKAKKWDPKSKEADKTQRAVKPKDMGVKEPTKKEWETKAKRWKEDDKESQRAYQASKYKKQPGKAEMEAKARKWDIKAEASDPRELSGLDQDARKTKEEEQAKAREEFGKASTKTAIRPSDKGVTELSKAEMAAKAKKWDPKSNNADDMRRAVKSADMGIEEPTQETWEAKAKKWKPDAKESQRAYQPSDQGVEQPSREDWEAKAKKWKEDDKESQRAYQPSDQGAKQPTKKEQEANAKKWKPDDKESQRAYQPSDKGVKQSAKAEMEKSARKWTPSNQQKLAYQPSDQGVKQPAKAEMEKKARKWTPKNQEKSAYQPSDQGVKQLSKSQMAAKAQKWPSKKRAVDVAKFLSKK